MRCGAVRCRILTGWLERSAWPRLESSLARVGRWIRLLDLAFVRLRQDRTLNFVSLFPRALAIARKHARTHARTPSEWRVCAVALRHICISALVKVARADPTRDAGVLRARKASNMQAVSSRTSWRCPCLAALAWRPQLVRRTTRRSGSNRAPLPCSRLSKFDARGFEASRRPRGSEETSLRAHSARFKGRASSSAIGPSLDAGRGTVWVYAVQAARRERRHATPPSRGTGRVPGNLTSSLRPMAAVRRINSVELCRGFGRSESTSRSCEAWTFGCLTCAGSGRLSVIGGMFVL